MLGSLAPQSARARFVFALVALLGTALPGRVRAEPATGAVPLLAGPVLLGPADVQLGTPQVTVSFGEGARMSHVEIALPVTSATGGDLGLGLGGLGGWDLTADLDGAPVSVARATGLPLGDTTYDVEFTVAAHLEPGVPATLHLHALGDTAAAPRVPELTYPEAALVLNRLLDEPQARSVRLLVGPSLARTPGLRLRVDAVPPQRPEAPVTGQVVVAGGKATLEGPVSADLSGPLEISAMEGDTTPPRHWGILFGLGGAVDWPREYGQIACTTRAADGSCSVPERGFFTVDGVNPIARVWFRGGVDVVLNAHWMFETGVEGDFAGALELPLQFLYYPQTGHPQPFDLFGDYHFLFGLAMQFINNRMPRDDGFDPRPFLRLGVGVRFLLLTIEAVYEIAPPLGAWHDRFGGLEHKLLITLPFRF